MGFFGDVVRGITGGSKSTSSNQSQSGFALLPEEIQNAYTGYASDLNNILQGGNLTNMYTPLGQTSYETNALSAISQGVTPTAESLQADIAMQMNPYQNFVIDEVNRQAAGDYSILKQAANEAGQLGSNRQMLGANDIEQTRLNTIGKLQQDQYNTALNNSLNQISTLRQGDIANQFTAGEFLRGLDAQTQQAPITGLTALGGALGVLPTSGGSTSSGSSESTSYKGAGSTLAALASAFSDVRLKENIEPAGVENGFNMYEFSYKNDPEHKRYRGVMAQEVLQKQPEAVGVRDGFLTVNYPLIGVNMTEVH